MVESLQRESPVFHTLDTSHGGIQQLDASTKRELFVQADLELARRARAGSLIHFALLLVIVSFSHYFSEHRIVIVTVASLLLALGIARLCFVPLFVRRYRQDPIFWKQLFCAVTWAAALTWGAFCCVTIALYNQQWMAWFILLITAGIAAGSNSALSPDVVVETTYVLLLLVPSVIWELIRGGSAGYPVAAVMALYGGYLWVQGRVQSQNYWEKLIQGKLLSLKTSELEEQGAYLKAVIEESPLAFVVIDPQHRIQTCNLAFERLFLYNRKETLGKQINELLQTEAVANEMVGFQRFAEMGNTVHATTTRRRKDGVAIPVEVHAVPLGLNGKFIGLCALYQDVTERKRAEEQMKSALQMKSDFISFATHQLRTPLAGIKWLLELAAQDKETSGETASLIQDARESAERLIVMVNDLLDISRLESGKVTPAPTLTSLRELTETVLKDVHPQLLTQKHELLLHGGEDFPAVCIDSQLFRQVIVNLVSNAIKYTPSGGKINIDLSQRNGLVRWSIRDTGIGIPKRSQSQLFEKFFRADNVFAIETEGTGLGLYMVRLILKSSGGRIWCESEEGKGSTFTFEIPAKGSC
jgi:PAS domain S-box-containing protein